MMFLEMLLDVLLVKAFIVGEYSSEHLQRWQILFFFFFEGDFDLGVRNCQKLVRAMVVIKVTS